MTIGCVLDLNNKEAFLLDADVVLLFAYSLQLYAESQDIVTEVLYLHKPEVLAVYLKHIHESVSI